MTTIIARRIPWGPKHILQLSDPGYGPKIHRVIRDQVGGEYSWVTLFWSARRGRWMRMTPPSKWALPGAMADIRPLGEGRQDFTSLPSMRDERW